MKDRRGNDRCAGYDIRDFIECESGAPLAEPDPRCSLCGGYGDYPQNRAPVLIEHTSQESQHHG